MQKKDVPQDIGLLGSRREIAYAVDEDGRYVLVPTTGWEPKRSMNEEAWLQHFEELEEVRQQVLSNKASPLAFHMVHHQMQVALLAEYVGLSRWRVRRHLRPKTFQRLKPALLQRYADLFGLTVEQLKKVPEPSFEHPETEE